MQRENLSTFENQKIAPHCRVASGVRVWWCGGGGGEGFREVNLAGNTCKWHRITKASACIIQRNVHQQIIKIYYTKNVFTEHS